MSGRPGLRSWEMREMKEALRATMLQMCLAIFVAGLVVGPHWVLAAYAVGGVLALAALRADRAGRDRGVSASRARQILGRICEWEVRRVAILAMVNAGFWVLWEFLTMPGWLTFLESLPEGETTTAEVIAAMKEAIREAYRQARENAEFAVALVGTFGIAGALLSGLRDFLTVGGVAARHGVGPWRVLGFRWSKQDWKALAARERSRRRRLLRGER